MGLAEVSLRVGRYELLRRLAMGGMGEVFEARQLGEGTYRKPVAVKLLLPHLANDPAARAMFLDEARLAAQLQHRNVVQIFDVGQDGERLYLVMELVRGTNLSTLTRRLVEKKRPIGADLLSYIGRCLCEGLQHAHDLRDETGRRLELIHRDVSPQNVLVSRQGEVKLTDFGIAKVQDSVAETQPGTLKGKFEYLAPEQARGAKANQRLDVYAAGVTLFQLATGISPYRRNSDAATLSAVLHEPLPDLGSLRPDLPASLRTALERAVSRDPAVRFDSARSLEDALPRPEHERRCAERLGALVEALIPAPATTPPLVPVQGTRSMSVLALENETPPPRRRARVAAWVVGLVLLGLVAYVGLRGRTPTPGSSSQGAPLAREPSSPEVTPAPSAPPNAVAPPPPARAVESSPPAQASVRTSDKPLSRAPVRKSRDASVPASSGAPGFLTIDAAPWATVVVDGNRVGETPLHRFPVPAGLRALELFNPESGNRIRRQVTLRSGQEERLRFDLR